MQYEEFIDVVGRAAGDPDPATAQQAARAALTTLAERLPRSQAQQLFRELPDEMKPWVHSTSDAGAFGIDEFLGRVARREGVDVETALDHARAVFFALGDAVGSEEVDHVAAALPRTFELLVAEAQHRNVDMMRADQFWSRVAQRLNVDVVTARRTTSAVLETLAERITASQVRDLMPHLDPLLHPPIRQGLSSAGPDAKRMPLEVFLRHVGRREGLLVHETGRFSDVFRHAHAVLETLAEALSQKEWYGVAGELPTEYRGLLPVRNG